MIIKKWNSKIPSLLLTLMLGIGAFGFSHTAYATELESSPVPTPTETEQEVQVQEELAIPENISVINVLEGVKISWDSTETASGYRIFRADLPILAQEPLEAEESIPESVTSDSPAESSADPDSTSIEPTETGDTAPEVAVLEWLPIGDTQDSLFIDATAVSGSSYVYTVICLDETGNEKESPNNTEGVQLLYVAAPLNLKVFCSTHNVLIGWDKAENVPNYQVLRKTEATDWEPLGLAKYTIYTDNSVESGKTYTYTVASIDENGETILSGYDETGCSITYIEAPKEFTAKSTNDGIQLNWSGDNSMGRYQVLRQDNNHSWVPLAIVNECKFTDPDVSSGTEYKYTVCYVGKENDAPISVYDSTGISFAYIEAPKDIQVHSSIDSVTIDWTPSAGAVNYRVFRKVGEGDWTAVGDTANNTYSDITVTSGTKYVYTVRCISADGNGYTSSFDSKGTSIFFTNAPKEIQPKNSIDGVKITWKASAGAESYRVFRQGTDGKWNKIGDTAETEFMDKDVKSGQTYIYTIRCISKDGKNYTSAYNPTGISQIYLAPILSKDLTISNAIAGVLVEWPKVTGATGYNVYRKVDGAEYTKIASVVENEDRAYCDEDAENGVIYLYAVRATTNVGGLDYIGAYSGQKTCRLDYMPDCSANAVDGSSFKVHWEENPHASGYRIGYSNDRYFSDIKYVDVSGSSNTEKTIGKLKAGTYYVFVSSYKKLGDKIIKSDWLNFDEVTLIKTSTPKVSTPSQSESKITWYWTSKGKAYHSRNSCPSLSRSKNIQSGTNPPRNREACQRCC